MDKYLERLDDYVSVLTKNGFSKKHIETQTRFIKRFANGGGYIKDNKLPDIEALSAKDKSTYTIAVERFVLWFNTGKEPYKKRSSLNESLLYEDFAEAIKPKPQLLDFITGRTVSLFGAACVRFS